MGQPAFAGATGGKNGSKSSDFLGILEGKVENLHLYFLGCSSRDVPACSGCNETKLAACAERLRDIIERRSQVRPRGESECFVTDFVL